MHMLSILTYPVFWIGARSNVTGAHKGDLMWSKYLLKCHLKLLVSYLLSADTAPNIWTQQSHLFIAVEPSLLNVRSSFKASPATLSTRYPQFVSNTLPYFHSWHSPYSKNSCSNSQSFFALFVIISSYSSSSSVIKDMAYLLCLPTHPSFFVFHPLLQKFSILRLE